MTLTTFVALLETDRNPRTLTPSVVCVSFSDQELSPSFPAKAYIESSACTSTCNNRTNLDLKSINFTRLVTRVR